MSRVVSVFLFASSFLRAEGIIECFVKEEAIALSQSVYGWCSDEKAAAFAQLVLDIQPEVCVELGVFGGKSLLPVAAALKAIGKGVVIGIDPFDGEIVSKSYDPILDSDDVAYWAQVDFKGLTSHLAGQIRKHALNEHVLLINNTSDASISLLPPIDILYIDGCLTEAASSQDASLYLPLVKKGGYIWVSNVPFEERQAALEILEPECDFVKVIESGCSALFKKR